MPDRCIVLPPRRSTSGEASGRVAVHQSLGVAVHSEVVGATTTLRTSNRSIALLALRGLPVAVPSPSAHVHGSQHFLPAPRAQVCLARENAIVASGYCTPAAAVAVRVVCLAVAAFTAVVPHCHPTLQAKARRQVAARQQGRHSGAMRTSSGQPRRSGGRWRRRRHGDGWGRWRCGPATDSRQGFAGGFFRARFAA